MSTFITRKTSMVVNYFLRSGLYNRSISVPLFQLRNIHHSASSSTDAAFPSRFPPRRRPPNQRPTLRSMNLGNEESDVDSKQQQQQQHHRFLLSPAAMEREKFLQFLDCLKNRQTIPDWATTGGGLGGGGAAFKSILYTAPYLTGLYGNVDEFTDVVDEWFAQVRPLIDSDSRRGELTVALHFSPYAGQNSSWKKSTERLFNIAYLIEYLGHINKTTDGLLVEKLGWANVSFLARRMVECGFFTYSFSEVTYSSLGGLRDLYKFASTSSNETDMHYYTGGLRLWLMALAHHLPSAEMSPFDWKMLANIRGDNKSSLPAITSRLRSLETDVFGQDPVDSPTRKVLVGLKTVLCTFAKVHFESGIYDNCKSALENGRVPTLINIQRTAQLLNDYANVWSQYRPEMGDTATSRHEDPDSYVSNSWCNWYEACNVVLLTLIVTENLVEGNHPADDPEAAELVKSQIVGFHYNYFSSHDTARLFFNTVQVACLFDETRAFYEILNETWREAFRRYLKRVEFSSFQKEFSFLISLLMQLAVLDAKRVSEIDIAAKQGVGVSADRPISTDKTGWSNRHEDTFKLAVSHLTELISGDVELVPYRAMVNIITALADIKEIRGESKFPVPLDEFLEFLSRWCMDKRRKRMVFNAAKSASRIKLDLKRLHLPPSSALNTAIIELEKLHYI